MPPKRPAIMQGSKKESSGSKKMGKPIKDGGKEEDFDDEFDKFVIKYEKEIQELENKFA